MIVGLVTTWPNLCGIAEYAQNLTHYVDAEFRIIDGKNPANVVQEASHCHLLHVLFEGGIYNLDAATLWRITVPKVLTYFPSYYYMRENEFTRAFNTVVVTEPTQIARFHVIPNSIPNGLVQTQEPENKRGLICFTCGLMGQILIA